MTKDKKKKNLRVSQGSPQKFPCITCKKDVTTSSIQCVSCECWLHIEQACSGLPVKLAAELLNHDCDAVQYTCNKCRSQTKSSKDSGAVLRNLSQITSTLEGIASGLADLQSWKQEMAEWRELITQKQASLEQTPPPHLASGDIHAIIRSELTELRERDKRRNTIIVKGMEFGTEDEFVEKFNTVSEILINKRLATSEVTRIKPKIVRLKIANREDRLKLLTSSSKLKQLKDFSHVYLSKDLTYKQRTELLNRRRNGATSHGSSVATGANSVPLNSSLLAAPQRDDNILRQIQNLRNQNSSAESPPHTRGSQHPVPPQIQVPRLHSLVGHNPQFLPLMQVPLHPSLMAHNPRPPP